MRGLQDANPSDLRLVEPPPPVQAGSWADALRRQVATLQSACNEYREEIHRLRSDLAAERGGPVGGIEVRLMGPEVLRECLSLRVSISEMMLLEGGPEAIRHLCRTAEARLLREWERRGAAPV